MCILPWLQCQFSIIIVFFQESLHIVGSMLCSSLKRGKDQFSIQITGQRLWTLNFVIVSQVTLGKPLHLLSFPTWEVKKEVLTLCTSVFIAPEFLTWYVRLGHICNDQFPTLTKLQWLRAFTFNTLEILPDNCQGLRFLSSRGLLGSA